jgi:hypothetical protein
MSLYQIHILHASAYLYTRSVCICNEEKESEQQQILQLYRESAEKIEICTAQQVAAM